MLWSNQWRVIIPHEYERLEIIKQAAALLSLFLLLTFVFPPGQGHTLRLIVGCSGIAVFSFILIRECRALAHAYHLRDDLRRREK